MGIRANGNLGHLLARRQKLLEKHDLAFLQGKTLKKGFKRYTKCGTISWENRTRSLKVENKQRAMKMGIRANGNLGQHFQKQASKWDPICSRAYCSFPESGREAEEEEEEKTNARCSEDQVFFWLQHAVSPHDLVLVHVHVLVTVSETVFCV